MDQIFKDENQNVRNENVTTWDKFQIRYGRRKGSEPDNRVMETVQN